MALSRLGQGFDSPYGYHSLHPYRLIGIFLYFLHKNLPNFKIVWYNIISYKQKDKDLENLRQKLKIFNYRPLVLVFLGICSGILVSHFVFHKRIITFVGIGVAVLCLVLYSILHKKFKYTIIFGLCFILGFGVFNVYMNARMHQPNAYTTKYAQGVVTGITNRGIYLELVVENVVIDGEKLDYNVSVDYYNTYQSGYEKIELGTIIGFNIKNEFLPNYYYKGIPNTGILANNIGMSVETHAVDIVGNSNSVRYKLLDRIRNNLSKGLNNLNGEMIYSAMFGDRTELSRSLYGAYKDAGLAHLLAVSGLHVGLVIAIIYWILKRLKVNGWLRILIVAPILLIYAYMCGFSYSIIRACIMAMVLMIAPLMFSEYDLLSSICFAGSLILLVEPIALFDLSAQLSFGCVFGIAMIYPVFKKLLAKIHINNAIADSFCISLATIVSTLIFMAYYFGGIQPIGLLSNIITIPIFSLLFSITFIVSLLSLIFPVISYILILVNPLFEWLNWFIIFISKHSVGIPMPNVNYLTMILYCIMLAFASKFNLKKGITKLTIVGLSICVVALQIVLI